MSDMTLKEDGSDDMMSGVEVLPNHSDDESTNNEILGTPASEAVTATYVIQQSPISKQTRPIVRKYADNKSSQQTITTMFHARKRKCSPRNADDASQEQTKNCITVRQHHN